MREENIRVERQEDKYGDSKDRSKQIRSKTKTEEHENGKQQDKVNKHVKQHNQEKEDMKTTQNINNTERQL